MGVENKYARVMRNTGPARFFLPLGILLIIFGILMTGMNTDKYLETDGRILTVTELPRTGDETTYDIDIAYTVDGNEYTTTFSGLSGSYQVGEDIKVFYDPEDPTRTSNGKMGLIAPILIIVGALVIVFGIYKTVTAFKKSKALDTGVPGAGFPHDAFTGFKDLPDVKEYYCRFDGKSLKPGYILEDADRRVLIEGTMTKQAVVGARIFTFRNHVTSSVKEHKVGHTTTQTYNDESFSASSYFKFDDKNIWDVIHERGVRISTSLFGKFPNLVYEVTKDGRAFAILETSGKYVHEDEAAEHKINIPVGRYFYRVWTDSEDLDDLFLTIFAISETEQMVVE